MSIANQISQAAIEAYNSLHERTHGLKKELAKLETRRLQIEATLHAADLSHERAFNFKPTLDGDFQCPLCWVRNGRHSVLKPIASDSDTIDRFRCTTTREHEFAFDV